MTTSVMKRTPRFHRRVRSWVCCHSTHRTVGNMTATVSLLRIAPAMQTAAPNAASTLRRRDAAHTSVASSHIVPMLSSETMRWK